MFSCSKQRSDHSALNTYEFTHVTEMGRLIWCLSDHWNHKSLSSPYSTIFASWLPFLTSTSTGIPAIMSTFQIGKRRKRGKEGKGTCKGTPHPQGDIPNLLFYFFPPQSHFASHQPYIKIEISSMFILTRTFPAESHVVFAIICCPIHNLLADMKIWRPEYGTVLGRQIWHAQSIKHIEYPPCAR